MIRTAEYRVTQPLTTGNALILKCFQRRAAREKYYQVLQIATRSLSRGAAPLEDHRLTIARKRPIPGRRVDVPVHVRPAECLDTIACCGETHRFPRFGDTHAPRLGAHRKVTRVIATNKAGAIGQSRFRSATVSEEPAKPQRPIPAKNATARQAKAKPASHKCFSVPHGQSFPPVKARCPQNSSNTAPSPAFAASAAAEIGARALIAA